MMTRRNRGIIYAPKLCIFCGDEYVPTSGRQKACMKLECRTQLEKSYRSRQADRYTERNPRVTEKLCEWPESGLLFPIAKTGVIPEHCDAHRKERRAPGALAAVRTWRIHTIDVECKFNGCVNLQHPSGQGWCYFHYPILSMHGLNADAWWGIYDSQKGLCPICLESLFDGRIIAIDHDHKLVPGPRHDEEHVRGLLHAAPCNGIILGGIETAIANGWFERALAFIQYPPSESN